MYVSTLLQVFLKGKTETVLDYFEERKSSYILYS